MNGQSSVNFATGTYIDTSGQFFPFGPELKLQGLQKQQFVSPPPQFMQDIPTTTPDLTSLNQAQRMAELERLSNEYTPEFTGAIVGELKSSRELATEYADADPVYVQKTLALYPTYTHYRQIRGDGNCAWRAIAFGYFELLLRSNNVDIINREWARLVSLSNLLKSFDLNEYVYEDFAAETFEVFRVISDCTLKKEHGPLTKLVRIFNTSSDSIIAYLKMLTSAWMKTSPSDYEAYLETTVIEYCANTVEPFGVELDHVGVKALIDCLVLPADFRVEISYLDRSAGSEVNIHHFESGENAFAPTLRLLYRPGHYDIIYKLGDLGSELASLLEKAQTSPVQVSFTSHIPDQFFASTPLNYFLSPISHSATTTLRAIDDRDRFRASLFQYPPFQQPPLPFQTSIFRNSAYNPSHYQSENFQPELYQPEITEVSSRASGRRRI